MVIQLKQKPSRNKMLIASVFGQPCSRPNVRGCGVVFRLEYLRQYPAFLSLGFSHGIPKSSCHKIFHKMRPLLTDVIELKNLEKLKAVVQSEMI